MHFVANSWACQVIVILSLTAFRGCKEEGGLSLREYLEDCKAAGIEPYARTEKIKTFTLRYPESLSERLNNAAAQQQVSVNTYIIETLNERLNHL